MEKRETLDTIWAVPGDLWTEIEPIILELATPRGTGRKRANPRRRLDGIIYRTRSSCHRDRLGVGPRGRIQYPIAMVGRKESTPARSRSAS
jgi:hypothetical protein